MNETPKCPQCGSRDIVKIRPPFSDKQVDNTGVDHYKCQLCGRGFNFNSNKEK